MNQRDDESKENHSKIFIHQRNDSRRSDQVVACLCVQQISNHAESQQLIDRKAEANKMIIILMKNHHNDQVRVLN